MVLSIYPKSFFSKLQRGPFALEFDEQVHLSPLCVCFNFIDF